MVGGTALTVNAMDVTLSGVTLNGDLNATTRYTYVTGMGEAQCH